MASEIYEQLVLAYTSNDNSKRQAAEQALVKSMQDNFQNFQFIAKLAETPDKMQEQAASLLNSVVLKMNLQKSKKSQQKLAQLTIHHAIALCQIVASQNTPLKYKQSLQKSMITIIKLDRNVKTEIENKMKELIKGDQPWQVQSGILFFKILVDSLELQSYNPVVNTGLEWIIDFFTSATTIVNKLTDSPTELNDDFIQTLRFLVQTVCELCEKVFKYGTAITREQLIPLQNILFQQNSLSGLLMIVLSYSPKIGKQINNNIILCTGNESFDNRFNEIKSFVLKSYMLVLQTLLNNRNKTEVKKGAFAPYINAVAQLLLYSILTYCNAEAVPKFINKPFLQNVITYVLRLLANLGSQQELYQYFSDAKISLITDVLYPFLITSAKEYEQMTEDPEEFVNLALDTVDKQESDMPKTAAASLLETLCDHIDGSTSFLAQLSLIVSQHSINEISQWPVPLKEQQQQFIQVISEKKLFKEYKPIDRIESSLVILTIMSYLIQKRTDIVSTMEQLLIDNSQFFLHTQESIIKVRLSLFFGYFCDNLFKKDVYTLNMMQYLQILIGYVQPQIPVVLYQAIDALKDVFEDDELKSKTKSLVVELFPLLCNGLTYSVYERHFEMIINLIKKYPQTFKTNENLLIGLLQIIMQRIISEQQLINNGDQSRYIYLNRCWNIIRALPEQEEIIELLPKLEQTITQLYQMLVSVEKIDYDEDLVLFISACIEKVQTVSLLQIQILPYFSKIIIKQHGRLSNLYETLNSYMHYGKNFFLDEQNQQTYFQLAFQSLTNEEMYCDIDITQAALLIQLGIQELKKDLKKNILQSILQQTHQILQSPDIQGIIKSRIAGIILSALYTVPELTYEILADMFAVVYSKVIEIQYSPGYDTKLFVITMSSLILKQPNLLTATLINQIVNLLVAQEKFEKESQEKHQNDFDEEDDYEDDDVDDDFNDEDMGCAIQQIEQFQSPLVKVDEYQEFKNTLFQIKQLYPQGIEQLKRELTPIVIQKLNEYLLFIRIETSEGNSDARKLIQAKKRKRPTN